MEQGHYKASWTENGGTSIALSIVFLLFYGFCYFFEIHVCRLVAAVPVSGRVIGFSLKNAYNLICRVRTAISLYSCIGTCISSPFIEKHPYAMYKYDICVTSEVKVMKS